MTEKRRKRGTGSIYTLPNGTHRAQIRYVERDGSKVAPSKVFPTYTEAESWLDKLVSNQFGGPREALSDERKMEYSFRDFAAVFMEHKYEVITSPLDPRLRNLKSYESDFRLWMVPFFGDIMMGNLHEDNVTAWIKWLRTTPSAKTGKKLSVHHQRLVWTVFKQAITWGVSKSYMRKNPIVKGVGIEVPPQKVKGRTMNKSDFHIFRDYIQSLGCDHVNNNCELRWELGFTLARRQGEALALSYDDFYINEKEPYFEVSHHLLRFTYQHGCLDENRKPTCERRMAGHCPKRHSGGLIRVPGLKGKKDTVLKIPLTADMIKLFKNHKRLHKLELEQHREHGTLKPGLKESGQDNLVFTRDIRYHSGGAWSGSDDYGRFLELVKEAGIEKHYRLHDLRHTSVTHIIETTGSISLAQKIAGHATILTTQLYADPDLASLRAALETNAAGLERLKPVAKDVDNEPVMEADDEVDDELAS